MDPVEEGVKVKDLEGVRDGDDEAGTTVGDEVGDSVSGVAVGGKLSGITVCVDPVAVGARVLGKTGFNEGAGGVTVGPSVGGDEGDAVNAEGPGVFAGIMV